MIFFHRLMSLARWVFRRRDVEAELDRELDAFLEMCAADRIRQGETPHEARRRARMQLRGVEQTRERVRTDRWGRNLIGYGRICITVGRRWRDSPPSRRSSW